jgi:2-iminobutanoate/2-iminopropanoate deaminase
MSSHSLISPYRRVGNVIYTSGMLSKEEDTEAQVRDCFAQLKKVITEAGATLNDVVKVNIYLVDLSDREKYLNKVWSEYFPSNPPGRTTVQAGLAAPVRIEIEAVAILA